MNSDFSDFIRFFPIFRLFPTFRLLDSTTLVSTSELGKLMRSLGKIPSEAEVAEMIKQVHRYV